MLRLSLICLAGLWFASVPAQEVTPETVRQNILRQRWQGGQVSFSTSKQFVVRGTARTGWLPHLGNAQGLDLVRLDRSLLPVSAERVKDALLPEVDRLAGVKP